MRLSLLFHLFASLLIAVPPVFSLSTVGQLALEYIKVLRYQQQELLDTLPASRQKNQVKIQLIEDELLYIKKRKEMLSRKLRKARSKRIQKIRKARRLILKGHAFTVRTLDGDFFTSPPVYQRII